MKKILSILLMIPLLLGVISPAYAASDDITGNALETEMRAVVEKGIMNGYGNGVYKPGDQVTRGQFATFLYRALNLPSGSGNFTDVASSSELAKGIYSAYQAGIVSGYGNGKFGPNDPITREQMAAMIDRSLDYSGISSAEAPLNFSDAKQISPNFKSAVAKSVSNKIISGLKNTNGTYRFEPKSAATRAHAAAFIYRMLLVIEKDGGAEKPPVDTEPYKVATISNGQLNYSSSNYDTYAKAVAAITNTSSQVVTKGEKIVKMNNGIVRAKLTASQVTVIYKENLTTQITYVNGATEMKYLGADENKVQVQIAGVTGYVKQADAVLVPLQMITDRSFYEVKSGVLWHNTYILSGGTLKYAGYVYGKPPAGLQEGQKYYSWDGSTFTNTNGQVVAEGYQYFNLLSLRTKTNYTAEELNSFIQAKKPESPLKSYGGAFIEAQNTSNVNALYLLAHAILESNYGLSEIAKTKYNLFGINATDSNAQQNAKTFASFEECIAYLANYVSTAYMNPAGAHYNGAVLGNKSVGFNVKYASDPYWGQKIAGLMYQIDNYLGNKDKNQYKIAFNTEALNVRPTASTSVAAIYRYPRANMPLVLLESPDGVWYKIFADSPNHEFGYVHGDYVREINVVK